MKKAIKSMSEQYLTFTLGKELFALDIAKVREVLEVTTVSEIPGTPSYMRGVINLRGSALPVVEMRQKLGMSKAEDTVNTCIIILEVILGEEVVGMGVLVDSVHEVVEILNKDIEPSPKMGALIKTEYIKGMGRQGERFIIIVDVDSIFSQQEVAELATDAPLAA